MHTETSTERGRRVEDMAARYLEQHGLRLLARNYRGPRGEIDLIMQHGESIVFVEIRYRRSTRFGSAAESVGARKRARLVATALYYLQNHGRWAAAPSRFDVVAVVAEGLGYRIEWIKDAFQP